MADETVTVNEGRIKQLAAKYEYWATELDKLVVEAEAAEIRPGHVAPGAELLKKRYGALVTTQLVKLLTDQRDSFYNISRELVRIAKGYGRTEDLNSDDISRLELLIKALSKTYPEYNPLSVSTAPPAS